MARWPIPEQLVEHLARSVHVLECLAEDDVVEGTVGEVREVRVGVALDDGQPPAHAGLDPVVPDLDPLPLHLLFGFQRLQERSVPAPDIEHPPAGGHQFRDQTEVSAARVPMGSRL